MLGKRELCIDTMKQLRHPGDVRLFFNLFIGHMSKVYLDRNPTFQATQEDWKVALSQTKLRILQE